MASTHSIFCLPHAPFLRPCEVIGSLACDNQVRLQSRTPWTTPQELASLLSYTMGRTLKR